MLDLANQKFGKLLAVRPTDQRKNGHVVWECQCDCGNITFAASINLARGKCISCGCLRQEIANERRAESARTLIGQRFGRLTIVGSSDIRYSNAQALECKCDCGNTTYAALSALTRGLKKSCGCIKREKAASIMVRLEKEIVGEKFRRLTVLRVEEAGKNGRRMLECRCDCGKIISATETELKYGYRKSCGCIQKERNDQFRKAYPEIAPGQRYGKLTTLHLSDERINHARIWECKCDCGNIVLARAYQLSRGLKKSCGCLKKRQSLPVDTINQEDAP